ncbi:MAG: hypothetical protein K0R02_50 [Rickettsiaceae bacterium]|jgi:DNA-binding GntR family transcriptional regulator|nr:hypothetical protein [Rickettsiaceae bacterium]
MIINNENIPLSQKCYSGIKESILNGTFLPGQKLLMANLCELYKVANTPIREALTRLTSEGLVKAEDNKGFRVAKLSEIEIRDLITSFSELELLLIRKSMLAGDELWEAEILKNLHLLKLVEDTNEKVTYDIWVERNRNFHLALVAGYNSPCLIKIRSELMQQIERYDRLMFNLNKQPLKANHEEHREIAFTTIKRKIDEVSKLITYHFTGGLDTFIKDLKQNNLV